MHKKHKAQIVIYGVCLLLFLIFLLVPLGFLLFQSFTKGTAFSLDQFVLLFESSTFWISVRNSLVVSSISASVTVVLAFLLAYTINYTNLARWFKKTITSLSTLPMLLPSITYGFAIIYTFGKQGLITKLLGFQLFDIYGFAGLFIGYVIYTLPIAFLLINNMMRYVDHKFIIVSKIMQDHTWKRFYMTVLLPLIPTIAAAFVQSFFLSFTDFGIPVAVGGEYSVVATSLYNTMLGSIPDFHQGAAIAICMLVPSVISVLVIGYLDRHHIAHQRNQRIELPKHILRDSSSATLSSIILFMGFLIFAVIFLLPFLKEWPYDIGFTLEHVVATLTSSNLIGIYRNSLIVAVCTAILGTCITYGAAMITARSYLHSALRKSIDLLSSVANTIPGMVIGIAYLFAFRSTPLHTTFVILIVCNVIHFFSTPYVMAKNALSKMNTSYETTAMLMGDRWLTTIFRIVIPNSKSTILEMFSYYFTNSMVTISALIFIVGAKTAVLTTKIKELQHFAKFDDIFVLSLLILFTNILVKQIIRLCAKPSANKGKQRKKHTIIIILIACMIIPTFLFGRAKESIIIYSNADEEAMVAMRHALDQHGFKDQYVLQSYGTSELGGKLMAEGTNIEADMITMSSYYIDDAQKQSSLFANLNFSIQSLQKTPSYRMPLTALEGALLINTTVFKEKNLAYPTSLKDLTNPVYKGLISIPDLHASSTGWLFVQAIIDAYGDDATQILQDILTNVGPHLEASGSGPIKKVRTGEVAIAYGLRHQGLQDQADGLPIQVIDPKEGNMQLSESIAVLDKEKARLAMKMAKCIQTYARMELLTTYPVALYKGEKVEDDKASRYPKVFSQPLDVALLKHHQEVFDSCLQK